jgi:hypothetical protein
MSKLSYVFLLLGSVITATSIDQKERHLRAEESFVPHQLASGILHAESNHTIESASSLDASTVRRGGVTALNAIKSTGALSGYFSTIVFEDNDCSGSNVFGYGFLLGACVADYEFSSSTRREATETTMTIYNHRLQRRCLYIWREAIPARHDRHSFVGPINC